MTQAMSKSTKLIDPSIDVTILTILTSDLVSYLLFVNLNYRFIVILYAKCLPTRANNIVMNNLVNEREIDIFRDTYIRYLGYTNEVGEAFRSIVPKSIVWSSYVAACGYVVADTIHKGIHVYNEDHSASKLKRLLLSTSDTLIWQGFASVIIPGLTINRLCATVRYIQSKSIKPRLRSPWISTLIGLASIPLIIHPIDVLVEDTMNSTYRQWTGYKPPEPLKST